MSLAIAAISSFHKGHEAKLPPVPQAEVKVEAQPSDVKTEVKEEIKAKADEVKAEAGDEDIEAEDEEEADEEAFQEAGEGDDAMQARNPADGPVKLGFKSFSHGQEAAEYFRGLLSNSPLDVDVNEVSMLVMHHQGLACCGMQITCTLGVLTCAWV